MKTTHPIRHATHGARVLSLLFAMLATCVLAPNAALAQVVEWNRRAISGPSPRWGHAMAYDAARGVTVLFGGAEGSGGTVRNAETWEWNGTTWSQRDVSGPSARRNHAMAYDAVRGVTVLFGGNINNSSDDPSNETWEWNGASWNQRAVVGPRGREGHAMAYDETRGVTVLFGGYHGSNSLETWEWNGSVWTLRPGGPSSRFLHAMAFDSARGKTVLFGGFNNVSGIVHADTWEWNGTIWTQRLASGPLLRLRHAMAYDAAREVTVLFGGATLTAGTYYNDTWEWNGATWIRRLVNGPPERQGHAMAYDTARGVIVLFGGAVHFDLLYADTWEMSWCPLPSITAHPSSRSVCPSDSTNFAVAASVAGGGALAYGWQWQFEGDSAWVPIVAGLNSFAGVPQFDATGTTTTRVSLRPPVGPGGIRQWPNPGYRVQAVVSNACGSVVSDPALLTICAADSNCDGFLDFFDYDEFVTSFETGGDLADFNGDGFIDFFDYDLFVATFEVGC